MDASLSPYRSPEERDAALEDAARIAKAELHTIGSSRQGRPIRAARILANGKSRGAVLVCAGIHGLEYIGTEVALGLLRAVPELVDLRAEVWVVPSLNPDAYARVWEREGHGELKELRCNAHGVDLNRNYPLPGPQRPVLSTLGGWRTGSSDPKSTFYRGEAALSEPETAALDALCKRVRFVASANLHSTMGTMFPPCGIDAPSREGYATLCRAFRRGQRSARYRGIMAGWLDRFTGEQEDHQHHAHNTWAICVEHYPIWTDIGRFFSRPLFWQYNPRDPARWVDNDVPGLIAYFRAALELGPPK